MAHAQRGWMPYFNYAASEFRIKCLQNTAVQNGVAFERPAPSVRNFWPMHVNDLRAAYGASSDGVYHDSIKCSTITAPPFILDANWSDEFGNSYITTGLRQERFRTRDLK